MTEKEVSIHDVFSSIDRDIEKKKQEQLNKEKEEEEKRQKAINRFKLLRKRIQKFAKIVSYLVEKGYKEKFPTFEYDRYHNHFFTEGCNHGFGFPEYGEYKDTHMIGINNDGFCDYDFLWDYTKDDTIPMGYIADTPTPNNKSYRIELTSIQLNKFCDKFEEEEKLLYEWLKKNFDISLLPNTNEKSEREDSFYICKETECVDCPYQDKCLEQKKGA